MVDPRVLPSLAAAFVLGCVQPAAASDVVQEPLEGHWAGHLEHEGVLYPLRVDIRETGASLEATLDLPDYCIYGSRAAATRDGDAVTILAEKITLRMELGEDGLTGKSERFERVRADVRLVRESAEPVSYRYQELAFENGAARLAGTLVFPAGEGPFPIVVWTHGSGPDTRATFYYTGRAHLFAQRGIASLIYDKRAAGESTGEDAWKLDNLVADAVAAVRAVADHPEVDGNAIGIAGFSQGGWVAPMAAAREEAVDFVVVGATPGISVGEQNIYSATSRLRRDGFSEEEIAAAEDFLTRLYRFYGTGEDREAVLQALRDAENSRWFRSRWVSNVTFISEENGLRAGEHPSWDPGAPDPSTYWREIEIPVLSVWGADDIDVPPERSKRTIEAALRSANNTDYELRIFPDASHGFWRKDSGTGWDWPRQAPGCHQLLVDWVSEHVRPDSEDE